ncbi:MAG: TldD/PmbA family protein [Lachnospiraceae bacterium]|nr:TldD/PmbA family protein [Lachnospiraceae bacterium]
MKTSIVDAVLNEALRTGGDFSELYLQDSESNTVSMIDGKVETANYQRKVGAGVRVLKGTNSAYAFSADTSEEALIACARAAASALKGAREFETKTVAVNRVGTSSAKIPFSEIDNAKRIEYLREGTKAAKAYSDEVTQVMASYMDTDHHVFVYNSEGIAAEDRRPRIRVAVQAVAMNNGEAQTGGESPGYGMGFEALKEKIDIEAVGKDAARIAVTMLHAPECPGGTVPVVIDGGFGGVILHEACVHGLEATSVGRGNSVFCGKMGKQIASPIVTAVDDGTMPGEWGSMHFDDEGNPAQRNVLIENGILKSYLVDILGSRLMNHPITGSGRRQDYSFAPTSRMTNTFFAPGKDDEEEMIRTMGEGLFAVKMGGGSVNPLTGEFNFAVGEGYWVRDGKILCPVRGATLIGKGAEVLMKIDRIGKNMWMAPGMCGSLSGSIPTNVGQPRIRVSEIIVGGKGGALS